MRFVHIADMHFDAPFTVLNENRKLGDKRRLEQRQVFKKAIDYIKINQIPYFFISGDLYEQNYIRKTTIEYINNLFKEIPNTKIYIAPGNHDPYIKNSYYNTFKWNKNVFIFKDKIEKDSNKDVDVYGVGFNNFYMEKSNVENIGIENEEKLNILIVHGDLDSSETLENSYNKIDSRKLKENKFDYVALGHIHKPNFKENEKIVYPGSMISLGFDEMGEHGLLDVEIEKGNTNINFVKLDEREFKEIEIDVTNFFAVDDLVENLNDLKLDINTMCKIILTGKRNFEINKYSIFKLIENERIIKIKDETKLNYNIEQISKENSLRGIFTNEMLKRLNNNLYNKEEIEKALEIGLEAFMKN